MGCILRAEVGKSNAGKTRQEWLGEDCEHLSKECVIRYERRQ